MFSNLLPTGDEMMGPIQSFVIGSPSAAAKALRAVAILLAALTSAPLAATAQEIYLLQPGDQIRLTITELPQSETLATIGLDGKVEFPRLGSFVAAGGTLGDLQSEAARAATGETFAYYNSAGDRIPITLSGEEVFLQIAAYRPVYVQGHVARPGPVEFQPGLTARAAITAAGGESALPNFFGSSLFNTPNIQSDYEVEVLRHATSVIRLWGLDASIARDLSLKRPEASQVAVSAEVFDRLMREQIEQVKLNIATFDDRKTGLEDQERVLTTRIGLLSQSLSKQEEAVAIEEEATARVAQLQERGIASASRMSDARQALLLVSTRLLSVQDSLAQFTLQQKEVQEQLRTIETEHRQKFQPERALTLSAIWSAQAEIAAARKSLQITGAVGGAIGQDVDDAAISVTIMRRTSGSARAVSAALDDPVLPGDVLRVRIEGGASTLFVPGGPPAADPADRQAPAAGGVTD